MFGDAEYIVARIAPQRYTVAKFEGGSEPVQVYELYEQPTGRITCSCPAYQRGLERPCKHAHMVWDWQAGRRLREGKMSEEMRQLFAL